MNSTFVLIGTVSTKRNSIDTKVTRSRIESATQNIVPPLHTSFSVNPSKKAIYHTQFGIAVKNNLVAFFTAPNVEDEDEDIKYYYEELYKLFKKAEGPKNDKPWTPSKKQ